MDAGLHTFHILHCFRPNKILLDGAFHTKHELDIALVSMIHHLALVVSLCVVVDTTEAFEQVVAASIELVKPSCIVVEVITGRIDYYGPLDLDSLGLYTKFQKCVVQTHGKFWNCGSL